MTTLAQIFNLENPLFKTYLFYTVLLLVKMLFMSFLTGMQRFKNKAFANPEDAVGLKVKPKVHEDVERVRRAHLNDLENIPAFIIISAVYLMTNPSHFLAANLIRVYTIARYMHTLVYAVFVIPQPARAIAFFVGLAVTLYMAANCVLYFI